MKITITTRMNNNNENYEDENKEEGLSDWYNNITQFLLLLVLSYQWEA